MLTYIINAYTDEGDIVLDPFMGSGSTAVASKVTFRNYIGIDLEQEYVDMANERINNTNMLNLYGNQIKTGYLYSEDGMLHTKKLK